MKKLGILMMVFLLVGSLAVYAQTYCDTHHCSGETATRQYNNERREMSILESQRLVSNRNRVSTFGVPKYIPMSELPYIKSEIEDEHIPLMEWSDKYRDLVIVRESHHTRGRPHGIGRWVHKDSIGK